MGGLRLIPPGPLKWRITALGLSLRDATPGTRHRVSGAQESGLFRRDPVKKTRLSSLAGTDALGHFTFNGPPC